jgi:DNA-3-methyladenine glycosylase II
MSTPFEFLRAADPILARALDVVGPLPELEPTRDPFVSLARIIVGQQLSTHVARVIWNRVETRFPNFAPSDLECVSDEELRAFGLSKQKIGYLRDLALHARDGRLEISRFTELSDDEVRAEVVAVKGLGAWSADIFLLHSLARPDVLPTGDLGLREAMKRLYHLENRPAPPEMERVAQPWRPQRSLACRVLWNWLDSGAALENSASAAEI